MAGKLIPLLLSKTSMMLVMIMTLMLDTTHAMPISSELIKGGRKGDTIDGIRNVKKYLHQFGYLDNSFDHSDTFDHPLETAVKVYQENHHLEPTGVLDAETVGLMGTPRCGVPDIINGTNYMGWQHYHGGGSLDFAFLPGMPKWPPSKTSLTYAIVSLDLRNDRLRGAVRRAFDTWAAVTEFSFVEVNGMSDMKIGFYRREHGDGAPFDGRHGVLAHAFPPTFGLFHLDGDELWSTQPGPTEMDLESVCLHEIGHLLGLAHTSVPGSVMVPTIRSGIIARVLQKDDIDGIRALYNL